jgi:hypothetical protein
VKFRIRFPPTQNLKLNFDETKRRFPQFPPSQHVTIFTVHINNFATSFQHLYCISNDEKFGGKRRKIMNSVSLLVGNCLRNLGERLIWKLN